MKLRTKVIFATLTFFLCGLIQLTAQKATTDTNSFPVDSTRFFFFTEDIFAYGKPTLYTQLRNDLDGFQNYYERHASTGNAGSPRKELYLPAISNETFKSRPSQFSYFGYSKYNRRFYDSERPYTKIQLVLGQKEELNVALTHAHPFGKNCNIALGFNRVRAAGFYQRQNTNNTSVNLNGWYRAPGKRYALLSDVYWTTINVAENGGIAHDSDFLFAIQLDRKLVEVNLSSAENRQRMRGAWIKQYWSFGAVADTISEKNDTLHYRTRIYPSWAIVHTIGVYDEKYVYYDRDPQAGFYANVLRDTLVTDDSTYTWKIENGLWLERFQLHDKNAQRKISGKIGVRHESGEIFNDTIYRHFSNILLDGNIDINQVRFLPGGNLKAWMVLSGYNKGDYFVHAQVVKAARFGIVAEQKRQHPDFIYSHYSGNHFAWVNDLFPSTQTDITATGLQFFGKSSLVALSAGFHNYVQPVYFDENSLPAQWSGSVNAISGRLYVSLGTKSLKTKTDVSWNKLPANSPIRLPEFVVRESVYGNFRLFKKALLLQAGIDGTWLSSFYGDAYNPNISQFYLQDSTQIGNYLFLDVWVSLKIKPVRIFVKADHVNAGLFGRNYFLVPGYPQNDFALKFGISWVFND